MSTRGLVRIALASALLLSNAAAGVIVVSASGGGQFTDLAPAVAAANDGDILLLKSGTYGATTVANKALDLVADAGASVVVQGELVVSGLGVTRAVTLTGMTLRGTSGLAPALRLNSNAGSIRVQGCTVEGFDQPDCVTFPALDGGVALSVTSCDDVCVTRCALYGGDSADFAEFGSAGDAGRALVAAAARPALHECVVRGGRGGGLSSVCPPYAAFYGYGGSGGHGVSATGCAVLFASGCTLAGGDVGWAYHDGNADACPGAGARVASTTLTSLDCTLTAGAPGPSDIGACSCYAAMCGGAAQTIAAVARQLTAPRVVRENATLRIDLTGVPGDQVELVYSMRGAFQFPAAHTGVLLLRRAPPIPIAQLGAIGPGGTLSVSWPIADLGPGVLGQRLFVQATFVEPTGRALYGPSATIVLLDSSL